MFPAIEKYLSENPFFKAVKEHSVFLQLFDAPPQILKDEFGENWLQNLKSVIGEGIPYNLFLVKLAWCIERVRRLKGYNKIKEKLLKFDEMFYPTISEIENIALFTEIFDPKDINLENTFSTKSGKNPEFRVNLGERFAYFEATRIMDTLTRALSLYLLDLLVAFRLSQTLLKNKELSITVKFKKAPDETLIQKVLNTMNINFSKQIFEFNCDAPEYSIVIEKGIGVNVYLPVKIDMNKLKDKFEEKSKKFDEGEINVIIIDVTTVTHQTKDLVAFVRQIFEDKKDGFITAVILFRKEYLIGVDKKLFSPVTKVQNQVILIKNKYSKDAEYFVQKLDSNVRPLLT
jgi:hypothetical protein